MDSTVQRRLDRDSISRNGRSWCPWDIHRIRVSVIVNRYFLTRGLFCTFKLLNFLNFYSIMQFPRVESEMLIFNSINSNKYQKLKRSFR